jgi:hypothetical protein
MDPVTLAGAAVALLSPFMPALAKAGQDAAQHVAGAIAEKGGEAAFDLAKKVWGKVTARFGSDPEVSSLSTLVAASPEEESYQTLLAKALAKRLATAPDLAKELEDDLGGPAGVQKLALGNHAVVERVRLEMAQAGQQVIEAKDDARVSDTVLRQGYPT